MCRFRYAGADRDVLSNLSFTLEPNRTVALVGENGAGKTTIVKLLGRLYDPSAGEILVDGINLKDIDLDGWRKQMAVIFQDFASYHLTPREYRYWRGQFYRRRNQDKICRRKRRSHNSHRQAAEEIRYSAR